MSFDYQGKKNRHDSIVR